MQAGRISGLLSAIMNRYRFNKKIARYTYHIAISVSGCFSLLFWLRQ